MRSYIGALLWSSLAAVSLSAGGAAAQTGDVSSIAGAAAVGLVTLGSAEDALLRFEQTTGGAPSDGFLLRSPSLLTASIPGEGFRWRPILPALTTAWNSEIPISLNEGALWAGRGLSTALSGGVQAEYGPLRLVLAPQLVSSQNREFEGRRYPEYPLVVGWPGRSVYADPWHVYPYSLDMPMRFGGERYTALDPGQSSLSVDAGPVIVGVATENQWWGPGERNGIVMSNNAPGFPHGFLRTARPLATRVGTFEGKWTVGTMTESPFFDTTPGNDYRSLSGLVLTLSPSFERDLTLGASRTVYASIDAPGASITRFADVLTRWDRREAVRDTGWAPETEQITSLFARWLFPDQGLETYVEWARNELPLSAREFTLNPNHSQGYTLGVQWGVPFVYDRLRLQLELSNLEESTSFQHRPVSTFYTSRSIPQGYTHRGRVVGASIGPGSSSQWFAGDYIAPYWQFGVFAGRIRWATAALYDTEPQNPTGNFRSFHAYDVSMLTGLRGSARLGYFRLNGEVGLESRYNYLFQNPDRGFDPEGAVDIRNLMLRISLTPTSLRI